MNLKTLLENHRISQRNLADAIGISAASVNNIIKGEWPKSPNQSDLIASISQFLTRKGIAKIEIEAVFNAKNLPSTQEKEAMLLRKQTLSQKARKHFQLFSNPFAQDVQSLDELYTSTDINYVRAAMYNAAKNGGFIAVCAESGAGKSTLRRELIERIHRERLAIITIEPYILAAEDNDIKGKTLKSAHIAEAIIHSLAPLENPKRSPEARFRQLHKLLKESSRAGNQHVIIIEEAHSLPIPTLKHLKRFFELEDGFKKLLSIILIGQNELALKLSEQNQEVREVVQRCEIVTLDPLTHTGLVDYLQHRIKNTGRKLAEFIDETGINALSMRLSASGTRKHEPTRSLLYPLAIGNLITGALNLAADLGVPVINADIIREA
ncbi:AAA family ATPase [Agitococcus lubricus]|uniref:Type II secretory pathway predicted ATPase ExeA n=1 Tax=Agitococcus lubricus TaxID=1077255 RepID=A0A2T5J3W6_9GAMM|nr:AAA family ATPase [Agitococcus lubricus]PTQ91246.1 type II secretory pathway predicted ATPase ExeA [Agitococcus lubricus]